MISRRAFLLLASGLLVPDWLLDPPKGRAMVSVSGMPALPRLIRFPFIIGGKIGQVEIDVSWMNTEEEVIAAARAERDRIILDSWPEVQP